MVKIPSPEEQAARAVGERGRSRPQGSRSHHQWGARFGRQREEMKARLEQSDFTLDQLKDLAKRCVQLMEKHAPKSDEHYHTAMRLLREQHNLNFAILGDNSRGSPNCDELIAPER